MPTNTTPKQLNYTPRSSADVDVNSDAELAPFWETKTLEEMSPFEWERLCDGCGRCCLLKLEDDETGDIAVTRLACHLLDIGSCRCSNYTERQLHVPDCLKLAASDVASLHWLPDTCAYKLVAAGQPLSWWHPLISGTEDTVHEAGISVRSFAVSEKRVSSDKAWKFISSWIKNIRQTSG